MPLLTPAKLTKVAFSSPLFWFAGALLVATIATNLGAGDTEPETRKTTVKVDDGGLIREGTRMESQPAECRSEGDQLVLRFPESSRAITALENLATQRILKAVSDDPSDSQWLLTGTVTEFQGRNYLFIDRVTRSGRR